jgi:phospholipid-translocating ATPase
MAPPPSQRRALPKIKGAHGSTNPISRWYTKFAEFDVAAVFSKPRKVGPPRTVFVNQPLPADYRDKKGRVTKDHVYITNQVITSKYTVITFLPRNLLEQFRRVANMCVSCSGLCAQSSGR